MMWLLGSRIGRGLAAISAALLAVCGIYIMGRKEGAHRVENRAMRDSIKRQEDGRNAVQDLRSADRSQLDQRLRDNDGDW